MVRHIASNALTLLIVALILLGGVIVWGKVEFDRPGSFTEDAIFEVVDLVRMEGLAEIKRYMHEEGRHPLAHLITNIHVAQDADGVRLRCRGVFPISAPGGGPGHRVFHGSYYDRVVKTSAGWRIKERTFSAARLPCGSPGS